MWSGASKGVNETVCHFFQKKTKHQHNGNLISLEALKIQKLAGDDYRGRKQKTKLCQKTVSSGQKSQMRNSAEFEGN